MSTPPVVPQPRNCTVCDGGLPIARIICPLCGASNGRYVAVLESPVTGLPESAQCFVSDLCRITQLDGIPKLEGKWVLESSQFNVCATPSEVSPLANKILSAACRIMSLYFGLSYRPIVKFIQCLDTGGQPCGNEVRISFTLKTTSRDAMENLTKPIDGRPRATAIFEAAHKDAKIRYALDLYQDIEDRWPNVYDIIEFLGGPKGIKNSGFGTEKETTTVKQTANHYRHLGSQKQFPLPSKPPSLPQAAYFAKKALSHWIESRL